MDINKIFDLFGSADFDTPLEKKAKAADDLILIQETPMFWIGMFKKIILNNQVFYHQLKSHLPQELLNEISQGDDLADQATEINGVKVLAANLEGADANALRETMDKLKDKLKSAAIVLASVNDGKVSLAAGVTSDLISKLKAGDLVNHVASQVGGKGGGKPDMAMAGGTDASQLPQALASVSAWVHQKLN
jgi:alanyl-tRNA synthetase